MKSRLITLVASVIALFGLQTPLLAADRIALVVDSEVITMSEWRSAYGQAQAEMRYIPPHYRPTASELVDNVVNYLALSKVQRKIAEQMGVTINDQMVESAIQEIADRNGATVAQLRAYLNYQGISWDQYREEIRSQMLVGQIQGEIFRTVMITEKEVDLYMRSAEFQEIRRELEASRSPQVDVSHILIKITKVTPEERAKQVADRLYERLINGENFEEIAQAQSEDPISAARQGNLGWVASGQMVPEFERAMMSQEIGVIGRPIRSPFGYHIIRVNERKVGIPDEESLRNVARNYYFNKKASQTYSLWQEKMLSDVYIERRF